MCRFTLEDFKSIHSFPMSDSVFIHEVAPRDGLQNEVAILSPATRAEFVGRLAVASPSSLEVAAFVSPKRVPQMSGASELTSMLDGATWRESIPAFALVPNERGYEAFRDSALNGVTLLVSATESHSQANVGMSVSDSLTETCRLIDLAHADGFTVRAYVSMAFACPFEGETDTGQVGALLDAFHGHAAEAVLLADTLGLATSNRVFELVGRALLAGPIESLGLHLHDTHGRAHENVRAALELGVRQFDAAAGGTGGCPFAPGAAGNLDTYSLLQVLDSEGFTHDMHAEALQTAVAWLHEFLV
ncbi:MAG: hydroxymethylglutaryl-CoA lyase [Planctomycetes bacterium]|jgi:hydroxymethylglutaryl-CoA lyase|nr:hydroxymethylglutaryl-CoA lyase [Planctomycetota bacterium]